jgi:hypothetical protein
VSLNLEVQILGEYKNLTRATKGATKQLNGLKKSAQSVSRGINTALAAIGVGISFQVVTNSIKGLTQAAVEDIKAQTLLAQQLRNTVGASDAVVASVEEQIGKIQSATGVVDDELRPAYANLLRSTRDTTKAFRLLSLATDISAQTGKSLGSVSQALSRALNGNTASLVRFVPSVRNSTDLVGDLEKQFKGAAAAANNLDPYNRLKVAFDEVRETIGAAFLPALGGIATFIDANLPKIDALADAINNRVKAAFDGTGEAATNFGTKVIKAITDLTDFLNGTADADNVFSGISEKFKAFAPLVEGVGSVISGLIQVVKGLADGLFGWLGLFTGVEGGLENLGFILGQVGKFLQDVGYWIGFVGSIFVPFTLGIKAVNTVLKGIPGVIGKIGEGLSKLANGIGDFFRKVFGGAETRVNTATKAVDNFNKVSEKTPTKLKPLDPQVDAFTKAGDAADDAAGKVRLFDDKLVGLKNTVDGNKGPLRQFDGALGNIRTGLSGIDSLLKQLDGKKVNIQVNTNYTQTGFQGPGIDPETGRSFLEPPRKEDFPLNPRPGQVYTWYKWEGGLAVWYEQTWDGKKWSAAKKVTTGTSTTGGGTGDTVFQTRVKAIVAKLQQTLTEAKDRIKNASESFRDAVGLSFGIVENGFRARFSVSRVIAQMRRIKDAVKTFSKDIIELRNKGADAALIDELIGLGPLAGSVAARELVTSGSLNEFLGLRRDLASSGAAVGAAGNLAIAGTSTSGLQNAINSLNRTIAAGKGNTYNINIANPNITPQQIITAIKDYERKTGKKVFTN